MKLPFPPLSNQAVWIHQNAGKVTLFLCLLTLLAIPITANLSIRADLTELISPDTRSARHLENLEELIGGTTYHITIFESQNREVLHEMVSRYADEVRLLPEVETVEGGALTFTESTLLFLSLESLKGLEKSTEEIIDYYRRQARPFYFDLLDEAPPDIRIDQLSLEKKFYRFALGNPAKEEKEPKRFVLIRPNYPLNDFEQSQEFFKKLNLIIQGINNTLSEEVAFGFTGAYQTRYDEYRVILEDLQRTGVTAFLLITGIMAFFFRDKRLLLMGMAILGAAIIWTGAFAQITIGGLNVISTLLLAILLGLGIDFIVHFFNRYRHCRLSTSSPREALTLTYADISRPLWAGALTTSTAFLILILNRFLGFSHFGVIAGVGIIACCAVVFYGLPAAITSSERLGNHLHWKEPLQIWLKRKPSDRFHFYLNVIIVAICLLFTVFSLALLPQIRFDYNFANLQNQDIPSVQLAHETQDYFGIFMNPVILVADDRAQANRIKQMIDNHIRSRPDTKLDFAVSITAYPPSHQVEKKAVLARIRDRLDDRAPWFQHAPPIIGENMDEIRGQLSPGFVTTENLPSQIKRQFEPPGKDKSLVYVYPAVNIMHGRDAQAFVRELNDLPIPEAVIIAGEPLVYTDILDMLDEDVPRTALLAAVAVPVLLYLLFRRGTYVLMCLIPVVLGLLWMTGLMTVTGIKFNYFNAALIPGLIGVMLDNGIHILHRSVRERKAEFAKIFQKTGKAVTFSGVTTIAAFSALTLAGHSGTASLGYLGVLGFGCGLIAAVLFMPAVFALLQHRKN